MSDDNASEADEALTLETLQKPENVGYLGVQAASLLQTIGCAAFVADESGNIIVVNPTKVFIDKSAFEPLKEGEQWVKSRPVVFEGRPQQVMLDSDGVWWEVTKR